MVLLLLLVASWTLIQLPPVQTWLVGRITGRLSKELHTTIRVRHVDFALFDKMLLEGTLVEDAHKDTLLYAGTVKVSITDWWFLKDQATFHYIGLENATIKLHRTDSIWNYQFLVDYFSHPSAKKDTSKGLSLDLKQLDLANIHLLKQDAWRGEDMDLHLSSLDLDAEELSFSKKVARIHALNFTRPDFVLTNYTGRRPPPPDTVETFINDPLHLRLNPAGWDVIAKSIVIKNGSCTHEDSEDLHPNTYFDGSHIYFYNVNTSFNNLRLYKDTITAQLQLSTKERSGFEVKKLSARIKWFPEAMEFAHLDLVTGKSHLKN